jgi:hypothetical protein
MNTGDKNCKLFYQQILTKSAKFKIENKLLNNLSKNKVLKMANVVAQCQLGLLTNVEITGVNAYFI